MRMNFSAQSRTHHPFSPHEREVRLEKEYQRPLSGPLQKPQDCADTEGKESRDVNWINPSLCLTWPVQHCYLSPKPLFLSTRRLVK
uniref:Uncharacterized protein n=1 Tax=Octopus bimaculoides TaxID=37653 RepID=A0A0L8HD10_OCTBM